MLMQYPWYGNIRELKNITEQVAVVETERTITADILSNYLTTVPAERMPALVPERGEVTTPAGITDRELLLKALSMGQMISEMRNEINELRQMVSQSLSQPASQPPSHPVTQILSHPVTPDEEFLTPEVIEDDSLNLDDRERHAILRALQRNGGNRRGAAADLHISERTLYRKIKEYGIES